LGRAPKGNGLRRPPIQTGGGTVYGGTVYNGPTGGTVYGRGGARRTNSSLSNNAGAAYGAKVFYLIAGLTVFRTILTLTGARAATTGSTAPSNIAAPILVAAVVAGIFVLLGFFAKRGNKIAFVIGMLLYVADLVFFGVGRSFFPCYRHRHSRVHSLLSYQSIPPAPIAGAPE